jgi:hypothetical protein
MQVTAGNAAVLLRSACRVWDRAVDRPVISVVLVAAVIRIVVAVSLNVLDVWSLAPDAGQYMRIAEAKAAGRLEQVWLGYGLSLYDSTRSFTGQVSFLFGLFGPYRLVAQLVAVVYGVAAAGLTTAVSLRLVRRPLALVSGLVVAILPSQVLFSSVGLRESIVWALLAAAAVVCSRLGPRAGRIPIVTGVAGLAMFFCLLASLRVQTAIVALWCMTLALVVVRGHRLLRIVGASLLFLLVPVFVGHTPGGVGFLSDSVRHLGTVRTYMAMGAGSAIAETKWLVEETVSATLAGGDAAADSATVATPVVPMRPTVENTMPAGGDAAANPNVIDREEHLWQGNQKFVIDLEGYAVAVHNDLPANLAAFPRGLVAVMLRPVPWEAEMSSKRRVAGFESIIWLPLFVFAGVGAWIRRRDSHVVALPASLVLALTLSAAVTQGNLGTAFRHRGQILFALSILAVAGLQAALDHWRSGRMS